MLFKSFYTRIIFVLASMSLTLFIILAVINTIVFRNKSVDAFAELEKPRIMQLFRELDEKAGSSPDPARVKSILDSLFVEFNVDVFDHNNRWIAGTTSDVENLVSTDRVKSLEKPHGFTAFSKLYHNPNTQSPFQTIKIEMKFKKTPVLNSVFFYFILSGIISILVSSFVGWRLVYYLNQRLERLKQGVNKVASGDFNFKLEEKGSDEVAFLARKFNDMSRQLKKTISQLKEVNEARQRLIAHASHEIKSPLTSVKGFIDILEFSNVLDEEQRRTLLPVVKKDLNRVIKITNDMLQLARIRTPEYQLEKKKINIGKFLVEEHSYFSHKASAQKVTAIFENRIENELELKTDPERLSQILDNLWSNALKYGDHDFPILTKVSLLGKNLNIRVSNQLAFPLDAPGEQLFEPFYRNPNTSEKTSGSGLGLAIVKELTEKLKGKVSAETNDRKIEISLIFPIE
ncbi:MAG: HAMP domain-containing histidine kinase [Calditrichaeota bacterium]|nr:HAMP domain-containing histidine kinase [Calditrichota bacterium]